ncbi:MAG: hypothetical protein K6346_00430 [Halothiobacillaceae bacterium]
MNTLQRSDRTRFLATLHIVAKESAHLEWSRQRLFSQPITPAWVDALDRQPELAERLEAFVSRYGRLQDTIADKLLPRWLHALAERPGSLIEVLNRAEQLGVLTDVSEWLEARQLRNSLIHEYMEDSVTFAENIQLAERYSHLLLETYLRVRSDAATRLNIAPHELPDYTG